MEAEKCNSSPAVTCVRPKAHLRSSADFLIITFVRRKTDLDSGDMHVILITSQLKIFTRIHLINL